MQTPFSGALFAAAWGFRQGQEVRLTHLPPAGMIRLWEQVCGAIAAQASSETILSLLDRSVGSEAWLGALPAVLGLGKEAFGDLLRCWEVGSHHPGAIAALQLLRQIQQAGSESALVLSPNLDGAIAQTSEIQAFEQAKHSFVTCRPEAELSLNYCLHQADQPAIAAALLGVLLGKFIHPRALPIRWFLIPEAERLLAAAHRLQLFWEGHLGV